MTMNYCGRCGSANGTTARFCRQCGAELGSQAAISSSSTPLNVEFSSRSAMKNSGRETKPSSPNPPPSSETNPARENLVVPPPNNPKSSEGGGQDPKAISESLRRIRTSGPLIIEAIKQNSDRAREIIEQSIQGLSENKVEIKRDEPPPPPPPPAPPPIQKAKKRVSGPNRPTKHEARHEARLGPARQISAGSALAKPVTSSPHSQPVAPAPTQSVV